MRKQSKRGITLVELIICCAITLLLGGACLTVLLSGQDMFTKGTQTANTMMEAEIFQTFMLEQLPSASEIAQTEPNGISQSKMYSRLTVEDQAVTISTGDNIIRLATISDCRYAVIPAGLPASASAQPQLVYTLYFADGASLSGGFVMTNMRYAEWIAEEFQALLSEKPLWICSERQDNGMPS